MGEYSQVQERVTLGTEYFCDYGKEHGIVEHFKYDEGPFLVGNASDLVYKFQRWQQLMPRIEPFYAVKANSHPSILRILTALGTGFDCASKSEMESVLSLGVTPSRVIYANTCKSPANLQHAVKCGIELLTFDNEYELRKIATLHPKARLVIRIRADETGVSLSFGAKFGCELDEVSHLLRAAKQLGLNVVGVSFHIGFNNSNPLVYGTTIRWCKKVFQMAQEEDIRLTLLDIGGGFPGADEPLFLQISRIVRNALDEHFPAEEGVRVIAEPGTYFVEAAFKLYTYIIGKRQKGDETMYFLNDGAYGCFRQCAVYQSIYEPKPVLSGRPLHPYNSMWGPTCASDDLIRKCCPLPDMDIGEWVAFDNMGAYEGEVATTFNGFPKPKIVFAIDNNLRSRYEACGSWQELLDLLKEQIDDKLVK